MDIKKLNEILSQEEYDIDAIFKIFGVNNKKEMETLIKKNLNSVKIEINDSLGYISPSLIYEYVSSSEYNVFYEKLMIVSFFLKAFCGYSTEVTESFVASIGLVNFVFIATEVLSEQKEFRFFERLYNDYKQDVYVREQTERVTRMFEDLAEQFENIDYEPIRKILQEADGKINIKT